MKEWVGGRKAWKEPIRAGQGCVLEAGPESRNSQGNSMLERVWGQRDSVSCSFPKASPSLFHGVECCKACEAPNGRVEEWGWGGEKPEGSKG